MSSDLLASFFQCPTLNNFHPPQPAAVYLLILIWQGNHCSYTNLQQISVCSARKMRSTSSTPGASGIASGGCGLCPDLREALREGNLCAACVLLEQLHPWYASAQEIFCQLCSKLKLSFTLSESRDSIWCCCKQDFGFHLHWDWLHVAQDEPAHTGAKAYSHSAHLMPSWMQLLK